MSIVNSSPLTNPTSVDNSTTLVNASNLGTCTEHASTLKVTRARVVGTHGHWAVFLGNETEEWPLVLSGNLREFRHFESVVNQLKNYQIDTFSVELSACKAADKEVLISAERPRVLKRAGSAQVYDTWFRQQVIKSLNDNAVPISATGASAHMNQFKQTKLPTGALA